MSVSTLTTAQSLRSKHCEGGWEASEIELRLSNQKAHWSTAMWSRSPADSWDKPLIREILDKLFGANPLEIISLREDNQHRHHSARGH